MQFVKGVEFYRCIENHWFLTYFPDLKWKWVLDIGPWKSPLPSYLSKYAGTIQHVIDVKEGLNVQQKYARHADTKIYFHEMPYINQGEEVNLHRISDGVMDIITIVSTIEHFAEDGDLQIMSEIHRILKPGGAVYITVPYGPTYQSQVHYKWDEKTYNQKSIRERLHPGFSVEKEFYFKDRNTSTFTHAYWMLPKVVRFAIGRVWIVFAAFYIRRDNANSHDASLYGVVLRK